MHTHTQTQLPVVITHNYIYKENHGNELFFSFFFSLRYSKRRTDLTFVLLGKSKITHTIMRLHAVKAIVHLKLTILSSSIEERKLNVF